MSHPQQNHIPLTLYIHMPWCEHKCPYCDFNSHPLKTAVPETGYIDCLIEDFKQESAALDNRPIEAVFIGGGTPSLFSAESYERLLTALQQLHPFKYNTEITLEANPGSSEQGRFKAFRQAGINRLSIGLQSLHQKHLNTLQRVHSSHQALGAIEAAYKAGFDNINVDLMHGLPQQSPAEAIYDLDIALSYKPNHLSWYELTLEPNTVFYKHPPQLPDEETLADIQQGGLNIIAKHGYQPYEISAFSRSEQAQCRHNLNYWRFGDYLGIGAGAHSKLSAQQPFQVFRKEKCKSPNHYMSDNWPYTQRSQQVDTNSLIFEFMLNALRLNEPVPLPLFEQRTGFDRSIIHEQLAEAQSHGLINWNQDTWQTTSKGKRYLNELIQKFL